MKPGEHMNKILVNASVLQTIFHQHPEVEIDLVKGAAEQVAQAFKNKVNVEQIVSKLIDQINAQVGNGYRMPSSVTDALSAAARGAVQDAMKKVSSAVVTDAIGKALKDHQKWMEGRFESVVNDMIEKRVATVVGNLIKSVR